MSGLGRSTGAALLTVAMILGASACGGAASESATARTAPTTTTSSDSRGEANKALVVRYLDSTWVKRDLDAIPKFVATDLVNHAAIPQAQGAAGMRTIAAKLLVAFPDLTMQVIGISVDGDDVVVRVVFEGTQTGALEFKTPVPATNKHVHVDQVHTFRVKEGRIVETWMVMDRLELQSQLGVAPGAPSKERTP